MPIRRQNVFMLEIRGFWSFVAFRFNCPQFPANFFSDSLKGHEVTEKGDNKRDTILK